ncbi:MarR family winged helix-turn-helix transcriptional regulator [Frondihabitans peucedani]|uniref:HTH marR-type domain-containing protein n=1 Tax=Frondihabitans peucedani TaxID=598626 RepID=A0ABP8E3P3_9MICO
MSSQPTDILESLISSTTRLVRYAAQASGRNMSSATARTLSILSAEGPLRTGDLARASRISQPGMTKLLRTMQGDELVSRIAEVDDARAWLIQITPRGRAALVEWRSVLATEMSPLFGDLDETDWQTLEAAATLLEERSRREVVFA